MHRRSIQSDGLQVEIQSILEYTQGLQRYALTTQHWHYDACRVVTRLPLPFAGWRRCFCRQELATEHMNHGHVDIVLLRARFWWGNTANGSNIGTGRVALAQ